jgi:glycerol-3-phosphate acyltransferase PlsX
MLVQFAVMGSAYMEKVMGIESPKVALLNIGAEETKGRELEIEAYKLLSESGLNFVGNIEARDMPAGEVQVVVTDGFTGNVALKLYEGMGSFISKKLKWIFSGTGKVGALFSIGKLNTFRKQMDYKEVGGSALLGARKPVIKAHGSSDGKAFFNAIRQAKLCVDGNVTGEIESYVEKMSASKKELV